MEEVIKAWKEAGIDKAVMNFSCGGDSMNDWNYEYCDKDGNEIVNFELEKELEDETFNRVDFYVNSDGHYMGESGTVEIMLNEEEDDFEFLKCAESEWNEHIDTEVILDLTEEQFNFVKNYVETIQGTYDDSEPDVDYSKNFILTEELAELQKSIFQIVMDEAESVEPYVDGELQEYYSYSLQYDQEKEKAVLTVTNEYYSYTSSEE